MTNKKLEISSLSKLFLADVDPHLVLVQVSSCMGLSECFLHIGSPGPLVVGGERHEGGVVPHCGQLQPAHVELLILSVRKLELAEAVVVVAGI